VHIENQLHTMEGTILTPGFFLVDQPESPGRIGLAK